MDKEKNRHNGLQATETSDNGTAEMKQPISDEISAANQPNGQHSPPKEATAAQAGDIDSYGHGLFAQHLWRPGPQGEHDKQSYSQLATSIRDHYKPQGPIEGFLVEKIVTEMVRYARIIGAEQEELAREYPFYKGAVDKILRYSNSGERQLMRSMLELERLQEKRKTSTPSKSPERETL